MKEEIGLIKKLKNLSATQVIAIGFLVVILIGTALLCLPISVADGKNVNFINGLFTATTSVCVTGLVVVDTFNYWSLFGKAIILLLIQLGGLGVVSLTTSAILIMRKKVDLKNRLLIEQAFNLDTLNGLVAFLIRILKGTFIIEFLGAVCYSFVFIKDFGIAKGIWISIFNSVSAFCNAGMDIIGENSLAPYSNNIWVNIITMGLIIVGGIGFIVWWDIIRVLRKIFNKTMLLRDILIRLHLHTKIVLSTTFILILSGAVLVFIFEYNNPDTIGNMSLGNKILASFFQSVTTRTGGFYTISQKAMNENTAIVSMILMFIGGSSVGTAGGIKTSTIAIIIIVTYNTVRGNKDNTIFGRVLPIATIKKAIAVCIMSFTVVLFMIFVLSVFQSGDIMDISFEVFSAVGTTGLSRSFSPDLNIFGRILIIICMYFGRVGPISMAIAIGYKKSKKNLFSYPEEDVTVG